MRGLGSGRRPRLLLLSHYCRPVNKVGGFRAVNMAKGLARRGWDVTVVSPAVSAWRTVECDAGVARADLVPWLLFQEYVRGLSDCMYRVRVYATRQNEVLGLLTGRKLPRLPARLGRLRRGPGGEGLRGAHEMIRRLFCEVRYEGIGECEFKRDAATGNIRLIEVSPRSWSWVGITPTCGVNLRCLAYADLSRAGSPQPAASGSSSSTTYSIASTAIAAPDTRSGA